jgi:hypothetical protein
MWAAHELDAWQKGHHAAARAFSIPSVFLWCLPACLLVSVPPTLWWLQTVLLSVRWLTRGSPVDAVAVRRAEKAEELRAHADALLADGHTDAAAKVLPLCSPMLILSRNSLP